MKLSNPASPWSSDRNPYQDLNTSSTVEEAEWTGGEYKDLDKMHNSGSHQREGQNILYLGGHVKFENTANVGINSDNVWGVWGQGQTDPTDEDRQIGVEFLPTADDRSLRPSTIEDAFLVGETNE